MSVNMLIWGRMAGIIDGEDLSEGSLSRSISLSVTGNVHQRVETIANGANAAVYSDELGDFSLFYAVSDFDVRLALTDTQSNAFSIPLKGTGESGKYGVPFMLGDDSTVNSAVSINSAVAYNLSGSTAKVKVVAVE
jgi:hypothetical protein